MPETVAELGVNLILQTGKFFGVLDSTLGRAGQRLTAWGTKMSLAVSLPLMGLIGLAAKIGMEYETAFTGVLKAVEETTDGFGNLTALGEELRMMFRDLSMDIPMSATQLANLGATAGQLGIAGEDLEKFVGLVAKIGVTTNLSAEEAATSLARLISMMGLSIDQMDEMASTIVYLGNNTEALETEITRMALRWAGTASVVGISTQGLLGLTAAMAGLQIRAEMGGTAISRVLIDMTSFIDEGGKELELMSQIAGLSIEKFARLFEERAEVAVLAFVEGLAKFEEQGGSATRILEKLGWAEVRVRETLLKMTAGHEDVRHALGLANAGWKENIALDREFNLYAQTTESLLKMLRNRFYDVAISIKDAFDPYIKSALMGLIEFMDGIVELARTSPELLRTIVLIGAAIAAIGPALILIGTALKVLAFAIGAILSPLGLLIAGFIALAAVTYKFLVARYGIESFADAVVVASDLIARALNWIANQLSGLIDFIAQAAEWGASAMAEFARGIIGAANLVISAISYIAGIIASLLGPGSPPAVLPGLADWGREAINEFLYGMTEGDFDILNKVGDIIARHLKGIGFEDEGALAEAINRAQMALARVVFEARTAGEASSDAWQELRDAIHDSTGDIERYIRLRMELTQAEEELAAIEQHRTEVMDQLDEERFHMQMRHKEQLRAADKKVQAAEEALQKFREQTAEIPERFTRGRERQLQAELRAAQKERDSTRERHDIEMTQFEVRRHQIQETLDAQVEAAQEARDLLQKQVRWLEELIGTRLDLFESYDAEKSGLEDLSAIFDDMKRNVEDIFPSMEGLTGKFNEAKKAAEGLFSIWKAFWLGITGAPIDELDVLTYDTVRMWEAGKKLRDAWDKFVGVIDRVVIALDPLIQKFNELGAPEKFAISFAALLGPKLLLLLAPKLISLGIGIGGFILRGIINAFTRGPLIVSLLARMGSLLAEGVTFGGITITLKSLAVYFGLLTLAILSLIATLRFLYLYGKEALWDLFGGAKRFVDEFLASIDLDRWGPVIDGLIKLWGALKVVLKVIGGIIGTVVITAFSALGASLPFLGAALADFINLLGSLASLIMTTVIGPLDILWTLLAEGPRAAWEKALYYTEQGRTAMLGLISSLVSLGVDLITGFAAAFVGTMAGASEGVLGIFEDLFGKSTMIFGMGLDEIRQGIRQFKDDAVGFFMNLHDEVVAWIETLIQDTLFWFNFLQETLIGGSIVPDMVSDIESAFAAMSANVVGVGEGMVGGLAAGMAGQMPSLHGALAGAGAMGGTMTGLQLTITNYWDASLGSKDRAELATMMENTVYGAIEQLPGGA